jgi:hypothetical protein
MDEVNRKRTDSLFALLPSSLLAFTAIVYASGFLVVQLFHDSYGLRELSADLFKIRYIHVGILFCAVPVILGVAVCTFWFWVSQVHILSRYSRRHSALRKAFVDFPIGLWTALATRFNPLLIFGLALVAVNFYTVLIFYPPGKFSAAQPYLRDTTLVVVLAIVVSVFLRFLSRVVGRADSSSRMAHITRSFPGNLIRPLIQPDNWLVSLRLVWLIWLFKICRQIFSAIWVDVSQLFSLPSVSQSRGFGAGTWYVLFSLVLAFIAWRLTAPATQATFGTMKIPRRALGVVVLILLYFVTTNPVINCCT